MSTNKRISGDYTVTTINPNNNINLNTHTVYINGNLAVQGNTVFTTNSAISSNFLVLNDGLDPNSAPVTHSGITVTRGSQPDVSLRWNEDDHVWQITLDGETYYDLLTSNSITGATSISNDETPTLGGNLDIGPYNIWSSYLTNAGVNSDAQVRINSNLAIKTYSTLPTELPGYTTITSHPAGPGGTGLYVNSQEVSNQELVSKRRALIYALVL